MTNLRAIGTVLARDLLPGQRFNHDELGPRYVCSVETDEETPDCVHIYSSYRKDGPVTLQQELHGEAEVMAEVFAQ